MGALRSINLPRASAFYGLCLALLAPLLSARACPIEERKEELLGNELWQALSAAEKCSAIVELPSAQRARALLEAANIRIVLGDYSGAEQDLRKAMLLGLDNAETSYQLACSIRERLPESLRYAERAAQIAEPGTLRSAAYRLAGEIRSDLGDGLGAQNSLRRALESAGSDLETLRTMVWLKRGQVQEASVYAERADLAAGKAPLWSRASALHLSARIWMEIKDYPKAMASLRRALEINGEDLDALKAMIKINQESPQEPAPLGDGALEDALSRESAPKETQVLTALKGNPEDLESLRWMIRILIGRKRLPEAASYADQFLSAVGRAPAWQQADAYRLMSRVWIELGDSAKAKRALKHSMDKDPRSIESLRLYYRIVGEKSAADQEALFGPLIKPEDSYLWLARARAGLKDEAGARKMLKKALAIAPDNAAALEMLAEMKLAK